MNLFVSCFAAASLLCTGSCLADDHAAQGPSCPSQVDRAELELSYERFDSSQWRDLLSRGCVDAAVALLQAYREANASRLTSDQVLEMYFHVGQAYAMSGRETESIASFEHAQGANAPQEWSAYVGATLAFLHRDAVALAAERARYAAAPHSSSMRLGFIDGFIACPDRPYMEAVHCGMRMDH